ncbi:MAG: outer membrane protein transport protein [Bacteroidota bacterium]
MKFTQILIIVFLLSIPTYTMGGGIYLRLLGASSLAMGNTGTGLALHASSVYQNPGAMAFLNPRLTLELGSSFQRPATTYLENPPSTALADMDTLTFTPLYAYAVARPIASGKLTLGMGVNSPYGGGSLWPDEWSGQFISQEFNLESLFIHPSFAIKVNDRLGLGLTLSLGAVTLFNKRAINIDGRKESRSSVRFSGQGATAGLSLGAYYRVDNKLSLGLNLRSPMEVSITDGIATFEVPPSLADNYERQIFTTTFTLPGEINIGVGYYPEERLLLTADLNIIFWSSWDSLVFNLSDPKPEIASFPERNWQNTINLRAGFEYALSENFRMRGGAYYEQSPVPSGFVSPELPDANRIGITGGAGVRIIRRLYADFTYTYEYTGERQGVLSTANFAGTYETTVYAFMIGLGYEF